MIRSAARATWGALGALVGGVLGGAVDAHATCVPVDEVTFRGLVLQAQAAVDRGDADLQTKIQAELDATIPCLGFAPPPRLWADYLMNAAIGRFASGEPWEPWIDAALRIRPAIDRGVGAAHPLAKYEPPTPPVGDSGPAPSGTLLYVDGLRSAVLPPNEGLYLVQRQDGRWWASTLVLNGPVPADWLATPAEGPPRLIWRANVGLGPSFRSTQQDPQGGWETDYLAPSTNTGLLEGHARVEATFWSRLGVAGELVHPTRFNQGVRADVRLAGIIASDHGYRGFGVAVASVDTFEGGVRQDTSFAWPHVVLHRRATPAHPYDLGVVTGFRPGYGQVRFQGGLLPPVGDRRLRIGADATYERARFEEDRRNGREVRVASTQFTVHLDVLLGEP